MSREDGFLARQPSAVDHAFAVLEAVADLGPGATARDLVDALPMSRATVYRIVKHLVEQEYLVRTPDLSGFMLGVRVLQLSRALGSVAAEVTFEAPAPRLPGAADSCACSHA